MALLSHSPSLSLLPWRPWGPDNISLDHCVTTRELCIYSCTSSWQWLRPIDGRPRQGAAKPKPRPRRCRYTWYFSAPLRHSSCLLGGHWTCYSQLYETCPIPMLYVAPCNLLLGWVSLFPLFLNGNATPSPTNLYHRSNIGLPLSANSWMATPREAVMCTRGSSSRRQATKGGDDWILWHVCQS